MPDQTLRERLPSPFPLYEESTDFEPWLSAHQSEVDELQQEIVQVMKEVHVGTATGFELDLIGREYGVLGRRRGRDDPTYRSYLISLVASFRGRGTIPGVKEAISSGLVVDRDAVELIEDFTANKYEVKLTNWTEHRTGVVHTMADLSDPLAIERREPLHYFVNSVEFTFDVGETKLVGINTPSESLSFVFITGDTTNQTVKVGLSGHQIGNGNTLGDGM